MKPFARNQWYVGAWSEEVGAHPLGRVILGDDIVFYRTATGQAVALSGACPHRWAPLALGRVADDALHCPYHGAAFDQAGRCVLAPSQPRAPPDFRLRSYPVVERGSCIWIWPGDVDQAHGLGPPDEASLGLGAHGWRTDCSAPALVNARAQIILENLFDQSHIDFVHPTTLGNRARRSDRREHHITDTPERFRVTHEMQLTAADDGVKALFPDAGNHVAVQMHVELLGVALVNSVGSQTFGADAQGNARRPLGCLNFIHGLTPQTATTTHYFSAVARDFALDDEALSAFLSDRNAQVIREDVRILEAIEPRLDQLADPRREASFASDAAAMRLRRRIKQIIGRDGDAHR